MEQFVTTIPDVFARTVIEMHGATGEAWRRRFPALLEDCVRRWSLDVGPPFPGVTYHYVAPATRADGARAVLKIGYPDQEAVAEIEALRLYDGRGIARLLEADPEVSALLIERVEPGRSLAEVWEEVGDERATSVAAGVMRALWRPAPPQHPFPTVADWAKGMERLRRRFEGGTGPLPRLLVEEAERLFDELIPSTTEPVLLHGDLHHGNVLAATRAPWLAIDPKGLVGEPAYEVGALLLNPEGLLARPDLPDVMERRVHRLAEELHLDRARVRGWGLAQAVLSAWWSIEDHGHGWEDAITLAGHLARVRP